MLAYVVTDPLIRLRRGLQRLANPRGWMEPLLDEFATIVIEDNRAFLMMARDIHGKGYFPVKRAYGGPPLLREKYRPINSLVVKTKQTGKNTFVLEKGWPSFVAKNGRNILAMHSNPGPKAKYRRRDAFGYHVETINRINQAGVRYTRREFKAIFAQPGGGYLMGQF